MTADFFVFGHFDQKNKKWNEPVNNLNQEPLNISSYEIAT